MDCEPAESHDCRSNGQQSPEIKLKLWTQWHVSIQLSIDDFLHICKGLPLEFIPSTLNIITTNNTHYLASQAEFWSKYRLKRGVKLEETDQIMGV
jgi:hypothetical protein